MLNWLWFLCREVKSLTLVYLRVVTGCEDGKIRVFNFLTGDCLREITAEAETGQILSLHFHDDRWVMHSHESLLFLPVCMNFSLIFQLLQYTSEHDVQCEALPVCQSVLGLHSRRRLCWCVWWTCSSSQKASSRFRQGRSQETRESYAASPLSLPAYSHKKSSTR